MQEAPPTDEGDEGEEVDYYDGEYYDEEGEEAQEIDFSLPFPAEIPMEGNTKLLSSIPLPLYYPLVAGAAAAAAFVGLAAGKGAPVSPQSRDAVAYTTAAVCAGAVLYGGAQAKKVRDRAAVVDLFNLLVYMDEPSALTPDDVSAVGAKYGVNMRRDQLEGLVQIFGQYLEGVVPKGDAPLRRRPGGLAAAAWGMGPPASRADSAPGTWHAAAAAGRAGGDEASKILAFKDALSLTDEEAAPAFIEVGRRLSRAGFEIQGRQAQFEQRKAFQRLIYLSYAALGDQKAGTLLPWGAEFGLNDAQLFVARRDNARAVFGQHLLESYGGDLPADADALRALREFQGTVKLLDDVAEDSVRAAARSHVERQLAAALEQLRAPISTRDVGRVVEEVHAILDYSRRLQALAGEEGLVPGVGAPSLAGGAWVEGLRRRDVKDLYRAYCEERTGKEGAFTPEIEADLKDLSQIFTLAPKEAADLRAEVAAGLYRRLLKDEVTSKRIDAAASPAQLVAKKKLTPGDSQELQRIRRILCIPQDTANEIMKATSGHVLEESLEQAFAAGPRPLTEFDLAKVDDVIKDLQMDRAVAKAVYAEAARKKLKSFAGQAVKDLQQNDRKAAAIQLKKMVQFNSLVVTPLLERVAGTEAAKKELAELMAKAAEAAKKEEEAKKAAAAAAGGDADKEGAQKEFEEILAQATAAAKKEEEAEEAAKQSAEAPSSSDAAAAAAAPPVPQVEAVEASSSGGDSSSSGGAAAADAVIDVAAEAPAGAAAAAAAAAAEAEEARRALEEAERKKKEDEDPVKVMKKMIAASRGEFGEDEKKAQKDISLANDVDKAVRADLYKVYLMYSMSGDVVELPVGGTIRKKTSNETRAQDMARLQQLGDILGMNQMEVAS
ncbi:hypothetical protein MNEG_9237, partial [Monoraphidium neglectum]